MSRSQTFSEEFDVVKAVPSACAQLFKENKVDVAIVPVGAVEAIGDYKILSDFCIGAHKIVKTVSVFSKEPLDQINCIYLDTDSRSSVKLLKILLTEYWRLAPQLVGMQEFDGELKAGEALLCIGDKTFPMLKEFPFQYDLAEAWYKYTGLPFVFALWVQNGQLTQSQVDLFNQAIAQGIENRAAIASQLQILHPEIDFHDYYFNCINYNLDTDKLKAINLFLEKSKKYD